jgi:hypothetical protein
MRANHDAKDPNREASAFHSRVAASTSPPVRAKKFPPHEDQLVERFATKKQCSRLAIRSQHECLTAHAEVCQLARFDDRSIDVNRALEDKDRVFERRPDRPVGGFGVENEINAHQRRVSGALRSDTAKAAYQDRRLGTANLDSRKLVMLERGCTVAGRF